MQGEPATMQDDPVYDDVVNDVRDYLRDRAAALEAAGIAHDRICVDPGPGFGKTPKQTIEPVSYTHLDVYKRQVQEVLSENYLGMAAVLGADTMVVLDGEIFGKPASLSDAKRMLRRLSGRTHEVVTAVSLWMVAAPTIEDISVGFRTFVDRSAVTFRSLTDEEIADYLRKGESFDKAGAYAVQGEGASLVERVDGALDTVIGLPVGRLLDEFPDLFAAR